MYTVDMFTQQDLIERLVRGRVLTLKEVAERTKTVISHTFVDINGVGFDAMFYSNNHCFMHHLLPGCVVPCTTSVPRQIAARPGFESGWIDTAADELRFDRHCNPKQRVLETVEELVDYLNAHGFEPEDPIWATKRAAALT